MPCTSFNRAFAIIYSFAILALIYHHLTTLFRHSTTVISVIITTTLLISDLILAFMWATTTSFRLCPVLRQTFPENLEKVLQEQDFPAIDIFICTADPYKEPPINVVNTALSLMAYDYPPEKISVYVSDDGGSELTLFAFMEAAKFSECWLPFCRDNNVMDRCPEVYFNSNHHEKTELRIENAMKRGEICPDYITDELQRQIFTKYHTPGFSRDNHPVIIQVLKESAKGKDNSGQLMPNIVYVSREKNKNSPHNFKAGALNCLLRVSSVMTNAPIVLTQDCDMYSNDPLTVKRTLCFISDSLARPRLGYVQYPQRYHGLNKDDIYSGEFLRLFVANPVGMDGLQGTSYVGSGCFFCRRVFFGRPTSIVPPEIQQLGPDRVVEKPITAQSVLELAHHVAQCNYENNTKWGFQFGFRYGSLVEDYFTGFQLHCEGWESIFCHPSRPAFLGDIPISLIDVVSQTKRWAIGVLEVCFSKYNPVGYGARYMGFFMCVCYALYTFWPFLSIPITIYSFLPQIALLNDVYIFPKMTDPWFFLYVFLFIGAYGQDCYDFILFDSTYKRWWNDQRMWLIRGLSASSFALVEYIITHLGITTQGFNVTSKVLDCEKNKRYNQGLMEFGIHSPVFVPFTTASIVNLIALIIGLIRVLNDRSLEKLFLQLFISSFGVLNSLPMYEAMILRSDKGRMSIKTIIISACLASILCGGATLIQLFAILALIYHHLTTLFRHSTTVISVIITTTLLISDLILAFMWATTTSFRLRPVLRQTFPENLEKVLQEQDFPAIDIFICTADPYKEPPINVVNTALSLMAYDYPPEKISVYVSDDGGSELTLFAFMEAAKFAECWLPFCRDNNVMDRCPEAYFSSNCHGKTELQYEKTKVTMSVFLKCFKVKKSYFLVLKESAKEKDHSGQPMPNLVYVSREKNKNSPHNFKAGALNSLLRVSSVMTNAPIVLTQDCDMYSNDPLTVKRTLCFISDPLARPRLGYVQYPQRYHGLNKDDIYGGEVLRLFVINPVGMDGLQGTSYVGSGCFFRRRVFFGRPTSMVPPEIQQLGPDSVVEKPITAQSVLELAHHVAQCNYENNTKWGFHFGFRYGSLVEDYFTGFQLQCEGWESIYCHPRRPAFLGDTPISLIDVVSQTKRWAIGVLEVFFSKYNPVGYGARYMGFFMCLCYAQYVFWPFLSIPITIYSFLPQIALLNEVYIFPKVTDPWFFLYVFLFIGAYGHDCYDFILFDSTYKRWWNDQRMWLIRGLSTSPFALVEYIIEHLGIAIQGFNVTSKVQDSEKSKIYDQGLMDFGIHSPMFVPFTTVSIVNLIALIIGLIRVLNDWSLENLSVQLFISSFGVLNSLPIYEAMILRSDKGRMSIKTIIISTCLAFILCGGATLVL
ncbi:hypothetical protein E3N88_45549 [Mikania micrantha]|uniref:Glycosyltransferase 2-like domain-containing protein n=1 Tax=Mikania micrantha TaxID=192012 RepID=A0A5N6L8U9_9ASTR|nr:hypothetical protein E3N88_45549 [Mikania micrantha]